MSDYKCDVCNYSCGNRKSSFEKHVLSQKHLNRVIELGFKENTTNLSFAHIPILNEMEKKRMKENEPDCRPPLAQPELFTFFAETIQRMERNIQLLSIQNKIITDKNTKLLQKKKHSIKETKKETTEQKIKPSPSPPPEDKMKEMTEKTPPKTKENERIAGANNSQPVNKGCGRILLFGSAQPSQKYEAKGGFTTDDRIFRNGMTENESVNKSLSVNKKMIEYFNRKHKDALNISTFYNQQRGISFTDSQMSIERILTTDITTLVYEWFCTKIETFDKDKLPIQSHKKITYVKIDDEWGVDNGEKEESFLETFLLPFYELIIKTNERIAGVSSSEGDDRNAMDENEEGGNRTEQEITMIERMMTKYMCMSKETKDKIMKKILKHPKIVCN
jgi:hypothetical protein